MNGSSGLTFSTLLGNDLGLRELPEEVREAIEERKEEIHSAEDLKDMADELMLKR